MCERPTPHPWPPVRGTATACVPHDGPSIGNWPEVIRRSGSRTADWYTMTVGSMSWIALATSAGLGFVPGAIGTHSRALEAEASRICFVVCVLIGAVRYAQ